MCFGEVFSSFKNLVLSKNHTKMEDGDFDQRLRDLQREYLEFLDDEVTFIKHNLFIIAELFLIVFVNL